VWKAAPRTQGSDTTIHHVFVEKPPGREAPEGGKDEALIEDSSADHNNSNIALCASAVRERALG